MWVKAEPEKESGCAGEKPNDFNEAIMTQVELPFLAVLATLSFFWLSDSVLLSAFACASDDIYIGGLKVDASLVGFEVHFSCALCVCVFVCV